MSITIKGNTIYLKGQPVASILDTDTKRQAAFRKTMTRLADLDKIELQVGEARQTVLTMAASITVLATQLGLDTGPSAKDLLS